jgi:hypothetical protein
MRGEEKIKKESLGKSVVVEILGGGRLCEYDLGKYTIQNG